MKKSLSILLVLALLSGMLAGCADEATGVTKAPEMTRETTPSDSGDKGTATESPSFGETDAEMFTERDSRTEYDPEKAVEIRLEGTAATATSDSVELSGSTVILREEATYVISGSFSGMLVVDAPEKAKLQIVLNGVDIVSETSAALYIREADKVFMTLAEGTVNSLANGGSFVAIDDSSIDGALFSRQDLTLNGSGALTVTSPAGHGIVCKDDLVITGGSYTVNAASHGLDVNDSVRIQNGALTLDAGKDAIHCENSEDAAKGFVYMSGGSVKAEAEGDGISASSYMQLTGGTVELLIGGGSENGTKTRSEGFGGFMGGMGGMGGRPGHSGFGDTQTTQEDGTSMKGLKAAGELRISGGSITVNAADDSVHSNGSVTVSGGTLALASGDDAIHAEDTLTVTAGEIEISESYEGLEALHILVEGGNIRLTASDDGLNAAGGVDQSGTTGGRDGMFGGRPGGMGGMSANSNGSILITGGTLYVRASGDGIDANGTLEITGGHTTVVGPTRGDTATLDYDRSAVISGGTFIGTGASGMAQTFSDSSQGVVAVSVGSQSAGTEISLKDSNGKLLISCQPELDFAVVILSTPEIVKGQSYTITVGTQSGTFAAG